MTAHTAETTEPAVPEVQTAEMRSFDVIVVGGGPGGYVAAIRAAQLGLTVAVVEREHLGGVCLNWGCIPTKALLHASDLLREMRHAAALGIDADPQVNLEVMVQRSRDVAGQLNRGVGHLLRKHKVTVIDGHARLAGNGTVQVEAADGSSERLASDAIILATGARARSLPGIEPDRDRIWTAREAMVPKAVPKRLLVIGAGAIGIEFASLYRALGSQVTVVEMLPRILPVEDEEISALMQAALEREGIEVRCSTVIRELTRSRNGLEAVLASADGDAAAAADNAKFDRAILAVGVTGNIEDLGLEGTGVSTDRGFIETDARLETGEAGVYALGDVAGPPCLAHRASHEGVLLAEYLAGGEMHPLLRERIPACTYAYPQVASVGVSERAARAAGRDIRVGRFPLIGNGKAIAIGQQDGLIKTLFDAASGELLGAHMIGAGVTELIAGFTVAMGLETTEAELMATVFPHPTVSEAMHESVLSAYDRALHI